jgi:hypothetical protein
VRAFPIAAIVRVVDSPALIETAEEGWLVITTAGVMVSLAGNVVLELSLLDTVHV